MLLASNRVDFRPFGQSLRLQLRFLFELWRIRFSSQDGIGVGLNKKLAFFSFPAVSSSAAGRQFWVSPCSVDFARLSRCGCAFCSLLIVRCW
ncbi:MAG: hypothetical protein JWM11_97 [Planctomycetaceae bacterium]|nr:hypothetical protein [Planctomycetaceae bacterium]